MEPFIYLKKYRVSICKKCEFACVSNEVPTHLQMRHRDISPTARRIVAEVIGSIPKRTLRYKQEAIGEN
jgi:c-di-GMP-binding flagellar brake protein YcgR